MSAHTISAHFLTMYYTGFYPLHYEHSSSLETRDKNPKIDPDRPRSRGDVTRRRSTRKMAKVPARLRAVTYSLSPMRTGVMHGLFKDWAAGMAKRVQENAVDVGLFCALPLGATVWCVRATRAGSIDRCARVMRAVRARVGGRGCARGDDGGRRREGGGARARGARVGARRAIRFHVFLESRTGCV